MLLRPLIDTYVISSFCLNKLIDRSISERDLIQEILDEIKINIDQGIVNYGKHLFVINCNLLLVILLSNLLYYSYFQRKVYVWILLRIR
jgi:hypothetical protein